MTYTNQEMIFFNSILDKEEIFGVKIEEPFLVDEKYIEDTIELLKKKDLIDEDNKLVATKGNPALFIAEYKKASKHVILNDKRIALCGEKYAVVIERKEKEYEVYGINRKLLLIKLIEGTVLMTEDALKWENGESSRFSVKELSEVMKSDEYDYTSVIQKYEKKRLKREYICLWNEETAELYDGATRKKQRVNGQYFKKLLAELLEIEMEREE